MTVLTGKLTRCAGASRLREIGLLFSGWTGTFAFPFVGSSTLRTLRRADDERLVPRRASSRRSRGDICGVEASKRLETQGVERGNPTGLCESQGSRDLGSVHRGNGRSA